MKRIIGNLYTLKGGEATARTAELKRILGLGESSAGFAFSEAATTQIDITGSATTAFKTSTGTFTTGINLGGTLGTGITIGDSTIAAIDITAASGRALRIGTKGTTYANSTALPISSLGGVLDTDPAKNYMMGVFTKVSGNEDTGATDDLGSAWFRTRVDKGATTPAGYSLFGIKSQLRIYSGANSTIKNWAAAGLLGVLEVSGATTTFSSGCVASAVYANVALTTTSVISSGAVVAGVVINSGSAAITNTGSAYYGLYVQDYTGSNVDFDSAIKIANSCATTGISIGTCTTGISITGTTTTDISITGASVTPIAISNTFSGNGIDFSSCTYVPTGAAGPALIRAGTYDVPLANSATAQSGLIRLYMQTSADGSSYDRAIFSCLKTTGTKGIITTAGLAEVLADATGPANVKGCEFIADLHETGSHLPASAIMYGGWFKVTAIDGATINASAKVAPLWLDNQLYGANATGALEYTIWNTAGGTVPKAWAGFGTTSAGWDQLIYFDTTMAAQEPFMASGLELPSDGSDLPYLKVLIGTTQYGIPLIAI